jgi:hypothetical protein
VFIDQALDTGVSTLLRTTSISSITELTDWADPTKASPVGPPPPSGADLVQASGGHASPAYYVGDARGSVWKLNAAGTAWNQIVPHNVVVGTAVKGALSWFVDPYDTDGIYVLDRDGVKVSVDGGDGWFFDPSLTNAVTAGGQLVISASLLKDLLFLRGERQTRFVFGTAGVSATMDFGATWFPVVNSIALPGRPESGFFDRFRTRRTGHCTWSAKGAASCVWADCHRCRRSSRRRRSTSWSLRRWTTDMSQASVGGEPLRRPLNLRHLVVLPTRQA